MKNLLISLRYAVLVFLSTFCLSAFGQGTQAAFENLTTVEYDNCTGIATVQFPVREDFSICGQADQLRWLDVRAVPPSGAAFLVGRVWKSSLTANPCSGGPSFTILSCRTYNYCVIPTSDLTVVNGTGSQRFVKLTIRDLPESFFGAATKFSFIGHYDYECCEGTNATYSSQGYTINVFDKSAPGGNSSTVSAAAISQASEVDCQQIEITWAEVSPPGGCGTVTYDIRRDGADMVAEDVSGLSLIDAGQTTGGAGQGYLPVGSYDYEIRSRWRPQGSTRIDFSSFSAAVSGSISAPSGSITANVKTGSGIPINGLEVNAMLLNNPSSQCPAIEPDTLIALGATSGSGQANKDSIYYGHPNDDTLWYRVYVVDNPQIPAKDIFLVESDHAAVVDLVDTTAYVVEGRFVSADTCGIEGATITAVGHDPNNISPIPPTTTGPNGSYTLVLPGPDNYGIYSSFQTPTGTIVDDSTNIDITDTLTTDVDIQYSKVDTVRGFVGGNCNFVFGPATVNVYSQSSNCLLASTISDAGTGLYELVIPSHEVEIKVEDFVPTTGPLNGQTLSQTQSVALDSTTEINFIFNTPLFVEVIGFPEQVCSDINVPIVDQFQPIPLVYIVKEISDSCLVDTGFIKIIDDISSVDGNPLLRRIPVSNGFARDTVFPGVPNILGDYKKNLTILAFSGIPTDSIPAVPRNINAIVTGSAPRGTQFTTVTPQIPHLILRAPPGDESYAFFEEGNTFSQVTTLYSQDAVGGNAWVKAKAGVEIELISFEAGIQIGATFGGESTRLNSEETLYEYTAGSYYETSSDPSLTGSQGDIYIGAAMNLTYANADIIELDFANCRIDKRVELVISPDSFTTKFVYSESGILSNIIPSLQQIVDDPTQSEEDRHRSAQGIKLWRQYINLNAKQKEKAFENGFTNISFDGGAGVNKYYFTTTTTESTTIEWSQLINQDIAFEAGFELAGSGLSAGYEINLKQETGGSITTGVSTSTTVGYNLQDDDVHSSATQGGAPVPDAYTVDVAMDPVYGTPVFRIPEDAGQTSCPYETGANVFEPYFAIAEPVKYAGAGIDFLEFEFDLGNQSELTPPLPGTFVLDLVSNPSGANVIVVGGGQSWTFQNLVGSFTQNVRVERIDPSSFYHFEGLAFKFYPECDPSQAIYREISAFFDSPCSEIGLSGGGANGFIINGAADNELDVVINEYDYTLIGASDIIKLEYAPTGSSTFLPTNINLTKADLVNNNPAITLKTWETDALADGQYDIRMELICTDGGNQTSVFSERINGVIDRSPPELFGLPEPIDDDYSAGDEISMIFDELIDMTDVSVSLTRVPENTTVPVTLTFVDSILTLVIVPSVDISQEIGATYQVVVDGVQDMCGNFSESFMWEFSVGDIDSDGDGYSDTYELCIGSSLDFSIGSANVQVPHSNALNLVENGLDFTLEAWINGGSSSSLNYTPIVKKGGTSFNSIVYSWGLAPGTGNRTFYLLLSGEEGNSINIPVSQLFGWHHVAVTFDGASKTAQFYYDGIPIGSHTYSGPFNTGDINPLFIGAFGAQNSGFPGRIDDVMIWQHKLNQVEIMATMAGALTGSEADLVAYYDFNDYESCVPNTGNTTAVDNSLNNFHGTLQNFQLQGCLSNWATERATDTDRDGIPDRCDEIEPCFDLNDPGDADGDLLLDCVDRCPATKDVALDFDGDQDILTYFSSDVPTFLQSDFAFEAWVNPTNNLSEPLVWFSDNSLSDIMAFDIRNQKIVLFFKDATDTIDGGEYLFSVTDVPINAWSHVAVSYDATAKQATFYLNGEVDGVRQSQLASIEIPPMFLMRIGGRVVYGQGAAFDYYSGRMDDVTIWSRTLNASEVKRTMAAPLSGLESDLVLLLDMNEGIACADNTSINMVQDKSPNNRDFTMQSFSKAAGCMSNFVMGRNTDSDGDMIGDACDDTACPTEYVVTSAADSGWGTLREAVGCAPSGSTITFASEINGTAIQLTSGQIEIAGKELAIHGNGASQTIIDGSLDSFSRLFYLTAGADVSFLELTMQNGGSASFNDQGGAMIIGGNSSLKLVNCELKNNETGSFSGGFLTAFSGSIKAVNCVFDGNKALAGRAGVIQVSLSSTFKAHQCLFVNNESLFAGACIYSITSEVDLINCTVTDNLSMGTESVITNVGTEPLKLFNNIIHGNDGAPAVVVDNPTLDAQNNLVDVPGAIVLGSNGNFSGAPSFTNAANGDFTLQDTSLAINVGNQTLLPLDSCDIDVDQILSENIQLDLSGASRVNQCEVDLGAYENQAASCNPMDNDLDGIADDIDLCPDIKDTALEFDGVDDYVGVAHDNALNIGGGNFTIEAWVYPTAAGPSTVVSKGAGVETNYVMEIVSNSTLAFYYGRTWHYGNITIPMNQWSHLAVSFDQSTNDASFYINGVLDVVVNYSNAPDTSDTNQLTIGRQGHSVGVNYFDGRIDDVALWDIAKTQAQITDDMTYPLQGGEQGLVAHYQFNDGFACGDNSVFSTASDNSPNGLDGQLHSFDLAQGCSSGWTSGRNLDSDNDGIGDACDTKPCPTNLSLTGNQLVNEIFKSDGDILSSQIIIAPAVIEYNAANVIEFVYPFEVQLGATLTTDNDGCD